MVSEALFSPANGPLFWRPSGLKRSVFWHMVVSKGRWFGIWWSQKVGGLAYAAPPPAYGLGGLKGNPVGGA
jgi:hypothetical protein